MGKTIDDALASSRTVAGSLDPFEGEGGPGITHPPVGTVAQESFESGTVMGRDVDRGVDAEPAGTTPYRLEA